MWRHWYSKSGRSSRVEHKSSQKKIVRNHMLMKYIHIHMLSIFYPVGYIYVTVSCHSILTWEIRAERQTLRTATGFVQQLPTLSTVCSKNIALVVKLTWQQGFDLRHFKLQTYLSINQLNNKTIKINNIFSIIHYIMNFKLTNH